MMTHQHKKITTRQAQAIKTKNKILKTSIDMMQKKGFDNITIEGISKKAGVSVGSFYYYFKSKNDILLDIFHKADDYFSENAENKLSSEHTVDQIVEFYMHYAKYSHSTDIDFTKKLYNTENKAFLNRDRVMYQLLVSIIQKGQDKNEIIKTMTAQEITDYLFMSARGVVFDWCLHDGKYDLEKVMVDYFQRMALIFKEK